MRSFTVGFLLFAATALAQTPSPSPKPEGLLGSAPASPLATPAPSPAVLRLEKNPAKLRSDSIFSALVLATNVETPSVAVPELASFEPKLKTIFGYNHFELIGSHTELMDNPDEHWLVPSKLFSLSIKSKREKNSSYLLNLQLFQETKMLTGFDAKLATESPLFIRGPLYGKGQLVIVVLVK